MYILYMVRTGDLSRNTSKPEHIQVTSTISYLNRVNDKMI